MESQAHTFIERKLMIFYGKTLQDKDARISNKSNMQLFEEDGKVRTIVITGIFLGYVQSSCN